MAGLPARWRWWWWPRCGRSSTTGAPARADARAGRILAALVAGGLAQPCSPIMDSLTVRFGRPDRGRDQPVSRADTRGGTPPGAGRRCAAKPVSGCALSRGAGTAAATAASSSAMKLCRRGAQRKRRGLPPCLSADDAARCGTRSETVVQGQCTAGTGVELLRAAGRGSRTRHRGAGVSAACRSAWRKRSTP